MSNPAENVTLSLPPGLFEALARRAAEILAANGDADGTNGWLRGAEAIAGYIGSPPSRVYALASCKPSRIPVHRDGSALVANRAELDAWLRRGGGKRP